MGKRYFIAFAICCLSLFSSPARCVVIVTGSEQASFLHLLNQFSDSGTVAWTGKSWSWSLSATGALQFDYNNPCPANFTCWSQPPPYFVGVLKAINSSPLEINLQVGSNLPGVLAGAFLGNGVQKIDLADILMFPASISVSPVLDLQSAVLLHEISEAFSGKAGSVGISPLDPLFQVLGFPPSGFTNAHHGAVIIENHELRARGSRGQRTSDKTSIWGNKVYFPWSDSADPSIKFMVLEINTSDITDIRTGFINIESGYNGSEKDITIEGVYSTSTDPLSGPSQVAEPSAFWLLIFGLTTLIARRLGGKTE